MYSSQKIYSSHTFIPFLFSFLLFFCFFFIYIILESLIYVKEKKNKKNVFVIRLTENEYTFGRNDKNDMVDDDISISRFHAVLKFDQESGDITLVNKSKFGILVLIKNNLPLINDEKIYFQIGRSYITVYEEETEE